ncbi:MULTISPECIES: hypothetical protein [Candidatus Ichthyocystis]|uniref:Uncharacterized protein n=1 Tax=Candidatus Ichthyocystis hellenicum TaxID=1561003 RepID=A0A0S4M0D9_9BURK|nr:MULTISPECIES: hypothetical protein [Ichthyocystis]CUT17198.1 hypothetical protein Ark11_0344 [Candidatus Ichthyocystis hellenicum]
MQSLLQSTVGEVDESAASVICMVVTHPSVVTIFLRDSASGGGV